MKSYLLKSNVKISHNMPIFFGLYEKLFYSQEHAGKRVAGVGEGGGQNPVGGRFSTLHHGGGLPRH